MKSLRILAAGAIVVAALAAHAARADDVADLKAKLAAGMAGVTSLRVVMSLPAGSATMIVVLPASAAATPHRVVAAKMEMSGPTIAMKMYIVDGFMYQSINGSRWEKRPLPDPASAVHLGPAFGEPGTLATLPDRVEGGVTFSAFSESPAAASPMMTFTCTYDKTTGRLHACGNDLMSMTYAGYNDPANVVTLPPSAKDAVELPAIPLEPPGAAPRPLGTP